MVLVYAGQTMVNMSDVNLHCFGIFNRDTNLKSSHKDQDGKYLVSIYSTDLNFSVHQTKWNIVTDNPINHIYKNGSNRVL